jgi:hypothetical protein
LWAIVIAKWLFAEVDSDEARALYSEAEQAAGSDGPARFQSLAEV